MHNYQDNCNSPYSSQQLFNLVIDIEKYPSFLPWCRASRILEKRDNLIIAELVISFKHITESYVSEVTFTQPDSKDDIGVINVKMIRGPFSHLENHWKFTPLAEGGSEISLQLSFKFRSKILDTIIGMLFGKASAKMVNAFKERADALYG